MGAFELRPLVGRRVRNSQRSPNEPGERRSTKPNHGLRALQQIRSDHTLLQNALH